MTTSRMLPCLLAGFVCAAALPARAGDSSAPPSRSADPARAKAREAERQRLIAKLHAESPKMREARVKSNAVDVPIFHRYDRP